MYATLVCDKRTQLAYGMTLLSDAISHLVWDRKPAELDSEKILQDKWNIIRKQYDSINVTV